MVVVEVVVVGAVEGRAKGKGGRRRRRTSSSSSSCLNVAFTLPGTVLSPLLLPPPLVVAVISMPTSSSSPSSIVFTPDVGFKNDVTSANSIGQRASHSLTVLKCTATAIATTAMAKSNNPTNTDNVSHQATVPAPSPSSRFLLME